MRYLVTFDDDKNGAFLSKWFDYENFYRSGMIVYDLSNFTYTTDGENWTPIPEDHL